MTAQERYRRLQAHNTIVMPAWSLLKQEERDAWQTFNREIENEKIDVAQRAVRDYREAVTLDER